jgi:hypothetical protein
VSVLFQRESQCSTTAVPSKAAQHNQNTAAYQNFEENQDHFVADGNGSELQQATTTRGRLYFRELLATNSDIDEGLRSLLGQCRESVERLQKTESALVRSLERDSLLIDRVERLMPIPAVGLMEGGNAVQEAMRFSRAASYGLVRV